MNIRALNYLRQILWWRKIQTADFGSHWNTCQFTHSVLSTRFRQLSCFFFLGQKHSLAKDQKKRKKVQSQDISSPGELCQSKVARLLTCAKRSAHIIPILVTCTAYLFLTAHSIWSSSFIPSTYLSHSTPVPLSVLPDSGVSSLSSVSFPCATLTCQFSDPLRLLLIYSDILLCVFCFLTTLLLICCFCFFLSVVPMMYSL